MTTPYFLFDIGASQTRLGVSFDGERLEREQIFPTPQNFEEGVGVVVSKANEICGGTVGIAVGGIAGPLDARKSMVVAAPNLPSWNNKPLLAEMEKGLGAKVHLENDTAIVGLGEAVHGAGAGFGIVGYMTLSTGVNGVRVVNGAIDANHMGFEIGSQIVDFDKTYDSQAADFEDLISGSNFERRFGTPAHATTDPNVWSEVAHLATYGLNNLIVFWSPEVVILGGSLVKSLPLEKLVNNLEETLTIYKRLPQIKKAELADFGGLWGALHLAKSLA